jgi:hypothetical protein
LSVIIYSCEISSLAKLAQRSNPHNVLRITPI